MRILAVLVVAVMAAGGCLDDVPGINGNRDLEARDFVTSDDYTKWIIEVDYATDHKPDQALLTFLHDRLAPVVEKPDGIEFRFGEQLGDSDRSWNAQGLLDYGRAHATEKTEGNTVVLHLLFVAGHHEADNDDGKVLGVTINHELIAIFSNTIDGLCDTTLGGLPIPTGCTPAPYYRAVLLHEMGHAIGLVDNGLPMVRDHEADTCNDSPDTGHSSNRDSVMTCAVESSGNILGFGANPPTSFDSEDLADLQAARDS